MRISKKSSTFAPAFRLKGRWGHASAPAQVAELVDALVSNTNGKPCRFDPGPGYYERRCNRMIIVQVKEGENIERAIKKFKRKFDKTGVVKELRRRQQFDKPSELKRIKMAHAKYVQSLHAHDDM